MRSIILLSATACLAGACTTHRYGEEQTTTTSTVYEGHPVAVLPPEAPPPPPPNAIRRERSVTAPPITEIETETQPPPSAPSPRATPRVSSSSTGQFPTAKPVPGKPGFVFSPFESNGTMIDVTGYASGTKVKDPGTNKIFIVP